MPRDDAHLLLGRPEQQHPRVRGLVAAVESNCELLARNGWHIEGQRYYIGHGGCGIPLQRKHARLDNGLLRDCNALCHDRHSFLQA